MMLLLSYRFMCIITLLFGCNCDKLFSEIRGSSAPFISGDTFRSFADHIFDETTTDFDPSKIKQGDIIFVKTDWEYLEKFFGCYHPRIQAAYILITHNSDHAAPGPFSDYLNDPKLLSWFAQNIEGERHPKLRAIPIGLANRCWEHGNPRIFSAALHSANSEDRPILCYMNFTQNTYLEERPYVWKLFSDKPWCFATKPKELSQYLTDLCHSKFVISPRGNGLDCHRTWEALLMGAIPIVRSSTLDTLFQGLPVLIVDHWDSITEEYLIEQYEQIKQRNYNSERLFMQYWIDQIRNDKK